MSRSYIATLLLIVFATACGPASIDSLCATVAQEHCDLCYECENDATGAQLCGLTGDAPDASECVEQIRHRCEEQASTLEQSKKELDACIDSLESRSCEDVYRSFAQGHARSTAACTYFL